MPIRKEEQSLPYAGILHNEKGSAGQQMKWRFSRKPTTFTNPRGRRLLQTGLCYEALPQRKGKIRPGEGLFGNAVDFGLIIKSQSKFCKSNLQKFQ